MDYRLVVVYEDASTNEIYCSTQADVLHHVSRILSRENEDPNTRIITWHVGYIWKKP